MVRLPDDQLAALARLIADELRSPRVSERVQLVDAATVADALGVSRRWVYDNSEQLGAITLGDTSDGRRPRLRFDLERARASLGAASAAEAGVEPSPRPRRRESRATRHVGSVLRSRPRT